MILKFSQKFHSRKPFLNPKFALPLQRGEFLSNLKHHVTKNDSLGRESVPIDEPSEFAKKFEKNDENSEKSEIFPTDFGRKNSLEILVETFQIRRARIIYREILTSELLTARTANSKELVDFGKLSFYHRISGSKKGDLKKFSSAFAEIDNGQFLYSLSRDILSDFFPVNYKPVKDKPITRASLHPYENETTTKETFIEPGATGFQFSFDERTRLEMYHDRLSLRQIQGPVILDLTGRPNTRNWPKKFTLDENALKLVFQTDSSITDWGYAFELLPVYSHDVGSSLPDSQILFLPSIDFAMSFVKFSALKNYSIEMKTNIISNLLSIIENQVRL